MANRVVAEACEMIKVAPELPLGTLRVDEDDQGLGFMID